MNSRLFTGIPCFLRAQAHEWHHYKPRAIHSNEERFDRFLTTFLHGTDWTAGVRYFAIYWLRFREEARQLFSPLFENGSGRCAEAHLVEHLLLQLSVIHQDRLVSVYILQNSSPCYWCSDRYVENLRGLIAQSGLHVTVVFSSLHRIMRPSCLRNRHNHIVGADHKHVLNTNGLKMMRMCGVELRTTQFQDWRILRGALQLQDSWLESEYNRGSLRKQEDDSLRDDLRLLLNS